MLRLTCLWGWSKFQGRRFDALDRPLTPIATSRAGNQDQSSTDRVSEDNVTVTNIKPPKGTFI